MSKCSYPVPMYRTQDGTLIHDNSKGLGISELKRPCGYCIYCRLNHAESWAIRMSHHAQTYEETSFLTLTYDDDHLPSNSSLYYDHVTKFIKKLRKALSKTPYKNSINYYRVGEYGENLCRPHYHLIVFGFDFSYRLRYKNIENQKTHTSTKDDRKYYKSTFLDSLWNHGFADIGDVDYATCKYVAKYVTKKIYGPQALEHYLRLNEYGEYQPIEKEKSSCSKGIGKKWIQQFWNDVYPSDHVIHNAKNYRVPKYYDKWLEQNDPILFEQVKQSREESMIDSEPALQDRARLHQVQVLRQANFTRDGLAPDLPHDRFLQDYYKDEINHFHFLEKRKKNVRS